VRGAAEAFPRNALFSASNRHQVSSSGESKPREVADATDHFTAPQSSAQGQLEELGASHAVGISGGFADDEPSSGL